MLYSGYLITFGIAAFQNLVSARFCDGGHRCSPPKECCAQGCCYLYAPPSAPRSTPPSTDHVLNLFFINHWYFWFVVFAIVLAILCACSLWKKRRQLCGWGSPRPHSQSGDSAGSCYAPPQYSRCSSFHHAPPPYTEVTSKPDLYPLVFTCNGDNTKNGGSGGSSYLMVQYFRNYIVRPVGSLSATSTVDSLSSSFICTANEQNTLVPPPYSRAASPDLPLSMSAGQYSHIHHAGLPRSASQQGCSLEQYSYRPVPIFSPRTDDPLNASMMVAAASSSRSRTPTPTSANSSNNTHINHQHQRQKQKHPHYHPHAMRMSESVNFQTIYLNNSTTSSENNINQVILSSQSDQSLRPHVSMMHSKSSGSVTFGGAAGGTTSSGTATSHVQQRNISKQSNGGGDTAQYSSTNAIYNSCGSVDDGNNCSGTRGASMRRQDSDEVEGLRRSLDACCQVLQQQQQNQQQQIHQRPPSKQVPCNSFSEESPVNPDMIRKYVDGMRSYVNSNTGSAVSSLANIGSPGSPPRATSPTGEVKELLEQIRQLQRESSTDGIEEGIEPQGDSTLTSANPAKPALMLRPSSLHQTRMDFFSKSNKSRYFPISSAAIAKSIRSPIGAAGGYASLLSGKGRGRKGWVSRSAPTTPGTAMPPCFLDDDSPLLNEQDEDAVEHNT